MRNQPDLSNQAWAHLDNAYQAFFFFFGNGNAYQAFDLVKA